MVDVVLADRTQDVESDGKDSTEEELEKLVFGDTGAFRRNLKEENAQQAGETILCENEAGKSDDQSDDGLELASDADVSFH